MPVKRPRLNENNKRSIVIPLSKKTLIWASMTVLEQTRFFVYILILKKKLLVYFCFFWIPEFSPVFKIVRNARKTPQIERKQQKVYNYTPTHLPPLKTPYFEHMQAI